MRRIPAVGPATTAPRTAAWLGGLCVGLALTVDVVAHGLVGRIDGAIHEQVAAHLRAPLVHAVLAPLALAGQPPLLVCVVLTLAGASSYRRRSLRPLATALVTLLATVASVWLVKAGIGRLAPSEGRDASHAGGMSYPSGHAAAAVVCWGLSLEYAASVSRRAGAVLPPLRRRAVTVAAAAIAGLAMAALDYHWLSDVLAGWLLGGLLLAPVLVFGPVRAGVSLALPLPRAALPRRARRAPSA